MEAELRAKQKKTVVILVVSFGFGDVGKQRPRALEMWVSDPRTTRTPSASLNSIAVHPSAHGWGWRTKNILPGVVDKKGRHGRPDEAFGGDAVKTIVAHITVSTSGTTSSCQQSWIDESGRIEDKECLRSRTSQSKPLQSQPRSACNISPLYLKGRGRPSTCRGRSRPEPRWRWRCPRPYLPPGTV